MTKQITIKDTPYAWDEHTLPWIYNSEESFINFMQTRHFKGNMTLEFALQLADNEGYVIEVEEIQDPRVCCRISYDRYGIFVPATRLAPRHTYGDTDQPAEWIPISEQYVANWYDDIDDDERLPIIPIPTYKPIGEKP